MIQSCLNTIAEHLREGRNLRLFVSQSSSSVCAHDAIEWMRGALDSLRIPANQISIELRMSDASAALSPFVGYCLGMKQLGVSLTLSGFEAGEQGSELLRHLPVDYVKLSSRYTRTNDDAIRMELRRLVNIGIARLVDDGHATPPYLAHDAITADGLRSHNRTLPESATSCK